MTEGHKADEDLISAIMVLGLHPTTTLLFFCRQLAKTLILFLMVTSTSFTHLMGHDHRYISPIGVCYPDMYLNTSEALSGASKALATRTNTSSTIILASLYVHADFCIMTVRTHIHIARSRVLCEYTYYRCIAFGS